MFTGVPEGIAADFRCQDSRNDLCSSTIVVESGPRRRGDRLVESILDPIRLLRHDQRRMGSAVERFVPIKTRGHIEELLYIDRSLLVIELGNRPVWEQRNDPLIS